MIALVAMLAFAAGTDTAAQPLVIRGFEYKKLETREATLKRMLAYLAPDIGEFGEWHRLTSFTYAGHGLDALALQQGPEDELATRCMVGGPGFDLAREFDGKDGTKIRWQPFAFEQGVVVDLRAGVVDCDNSVTYLATTIKSDVDRKVTITGGSDDGMRVWLNGALVLSKDVPRGLNPEDDHIALDLKKGVNHLALKVANGAVTWQVQLNTRQEMKAEEDAALFYQLDRDFPPSREAHHYRIVTLPASDDLCLEIGGVAYLKDGRPIVCTRRGDVFIVENAYADPPFGKVRYTRFATGLHEPLGINVRQDADGEAVYTVQRGELTRLVDVDHDDRADRYECFCDEWGVSGNYHEFAFGPEFDRDGNAWVSLNVGFCGSLGKALVPFRSTVCTVDREGHLHLVCDGVRSPNGIGMFSDGAAFYVDNQGDYVATNRMSFLAPGSWQGHPAALRWRQGLKDGELPPRQPPTIWFPYNKMGQSVADVELEECGGKFGPFSGQFFCGDQLAATVMRVFLEKVDGHYQGACFPFLSGFSCGVNRVEFAPDGSLFVGETDRGWGSVGRKRYGVERVIYTGQDPFEILAMRSRPDGFELEFTQDVDPKSAADPASYAFSSYTYEYHSDYGAPEIETETLTVSSATLLSPRKVQLVVAPLRRDFVHELKCTAKSAAGEDLLHAMAYYTLINIAGQDNRRRDDASLPRAMVFTASATTGAEGGEYEHSPTERPQRGTLSRVEERLTEAGRGQFKVVPTQDWSQLDAEHLQGTAVVAIDAGGKVDVAPDRVTALLDWVRAGGGLVVLHAGAGAFPDSAAFSEAIGATLAGTDAKRTVRARVPRRDHPIAAPLRDTLEDEEEPLPRFGAGEPFAADVLVRGASEQGSDEGGGEPLAWCRPYGNGRVVYCALGGGEPLWKSTRFVRFLGAAMAWAASGPDVPVAAPAGATTLLAGKDLSPWHHRDGGVSKWTARDDGSVEVTGGGDLVSTEEFGDALIHVEFLTPPPEAGAEGEHRMNSGVYVQGRYEIQVLCSPGDPPSPNFCGGVYGIAAPHVNACRPADRWQTYDIEFHAPRFDANGAKTANATMTVWHNGIRIHENLELPNATGGALSDEAPTGPLMLQDHGMPVRYRNVWVVKRGE